MIAVGKQASFLVVDGDPVADIHALERVAEVVYRGEIVDRPALLKLSREK